MLNAERIKQAGIDYDAGLARFLGDTELYEMVLTAFLSDNVLERAQTAFQNGDTAALLKAVHEAKGSSGNADLTRVYGAAGALVTLLRSNSYTEEELITGFGRFEVAYSAMRDGIKAALEE